MGNSLARSQIIGGVVMGIGITMLEQVVFDSETGRIAKAVYHATGRRIRSLPITVEQLL